jgi:hypothetical protein
MFITPPLTVSLLSRVKTAINIRLVCHTSYFATFLFSFVVYSEVCTQFLHEPSVHVMGWPELMWGCLILPCKCPFQIFTVRRTPWKQFLRH